MDKKLALDWDDMRILSDAAFWHRQEQINQINGGLGDKFVEDRLKRITKIADFIEGCKEEFSGKAVIEIEW